MRSDCIAGIARSRATIDWEEGANVNWTMNKLPKISRGRAKRRSPASKGGRQRLNYRPRLEFLEGRIAPAANTMTSLGAFDAMSGQQLSGDPAIGVSGEQIGFVAFVQNTDTTAAPTGTIQFLLDGVNFGNTQPLFPSSDPSNPNYSYTVSDQTSFTVASGTHSISAHYVNTDGAFIPPATDGVIGYKSNKASTKTSDVTSSNSSSIMGQTVTLTATVGFSPPGSGTPTGTVTFSDQNGTIGSAPLSSGSATLATAALDANHSPHTITASYSGDGEFTLSDDTSGTRLRQTVAQIGVNTQMQNFSNPASGQPISFTALVSNGEATGLAPTGTVQFTINGSNFGSPVQLTPVSGNANESMAVSGSTSFTVAQGLQSIEFSYSNTDGNFVSGGMAGGGLRATQISTTTSNVTSSGSSSLWGQTVTLTATVGFSPPGSGTPTGTVTFSDQNGTIGSAPLSSGSATLATAALDANHSPHTITATYGGDTEFHASDDNGGTRLQQTVSKDGATGTLASFSNPVSRQLISFTAFVSNSSATGLAPTGTIQFTDNGSNLGNAVHLTPVSGNPNESMAVSMSTFFTVAQGSQLIAFAYTNSDGNFASGATDSHSLTATANNTTTSDVTSVPNPSVHGQGVILFVTVVSNPPGPVPLGTVTFSDQNGTIGTGTLGSTGQASFSTSTLSTSSHTITASYAGSTEFAASNDASSLTPLVQLVAKASTAAGAVASSANPAVRGQKITLSASFTAVGPGSGVPTGTVTFSDQNGNLGTGTLSATGVATFSTSTLSIATHTITATYAGDANFSGIASAAFSQSVTKAAALVSVASSPLASVFGQLVTITATVRAAPPGAGMPTGSVTFKEGALVLGTGTLALSGATEIATVTTKALPVGSDTITAAYNGDANFRIAMGSDSASPEQVHKAATTTSFVTSANPSVFGQMITLTATLKVTSPGSGTPAGTVTFKDGSTILGAGSLHLVGGLLQATATTRALSLGSHALIAVYAGNSSFLPTSTFATQQVNKSGTTTAVTSSLNPALLHQTVTFSTTVHARAPGFGVPTGSVTFKDGTSVLAARPLDATGLATFATASLTTGSHTITAIYTGDGNFLSSSSSTPVLVQVVHSSSVSAATAVSTGSPLGTGSRATPAMPLGQPLSPPSTGLTPLQVDRYFAGTSASAPSTPALQPRSRPRRADALDGVW
jgi:hypothetical protein